MSTAKLKEGHEKFAVAICVYTVKKLSCDETIDTQLFEGVFDEVNLVDGGYWSMCSYVPKVYCNYCIA